MTDRRHLAIAAVSVVLGIMIVLQYRMTREAIRSDVQMSRAGDLALQLNEVRQERDELAERLMLIREQGTVEGMKRENEQLRYRAGLTPVTGRGVVITMTDSPAPVKNGENPNLYLIHDEDMLRVVNELKAAGAEAISFNEQRLTDVSEIRCAGPTVTVNGKLFAPPFVLKAVGDPKLLQSALTMRGGISDVLKHWGIELNVEMRESVTVPSYTGTFRSEFGKPSYEEAST